MGLGLERRKNPVHEEGISEAGEVAAKAEMNWGVCRHTVCAQQCVSVCICTCVCFYVHVHTHSRRVNGGVLWGGH